MQFQVVSFGETQYCPNHHCWRIRLHVVGPAGWAAERPLLYGGTEGSNLLSSRKESTANLTADDLLAGRAIKDNVPIGIVTLALSMRLLPHTEPSGHRLRDVVAPRSPRARLERS